MIRVDLIGGKELEQALLQLPKATAKGVLRRTLLKAAQPIEAQAAALAPRDTGKLQESIVVSTRLKKSQRRGPRFTGVEVFIGASSSGNKKGYHAHLVEFGTSKMAARPFMRPAFDMLSAKTLDAIRIDIWAVLSKAARTLARKAERGTLSRAARRALGGD
jgi:HK97 gp10 family phage protein